MFRYFRYSTGWVPGSTLNLVITISAALHRLQRANDVWSRWRLEHCCKPLFSLQAQQQMKSEPVSTAQEQPVKPAEVQCDWKEFTSPDGRKYYYNRVTKTSVWQMPEELKRAQALAAGVKAAKTDPGGVQVTLISPSLADDPPLSPSPPPQHMLIFCAFPRARG